MTGTTTKPDSLQPAAEMAVDLFDNWFDPIETEVRARAREFIEEMIRGELDTVLARPRYSRSRKAGNEERAGIAGHRHGSRRRSLTGTFAPARDRGAARPTEYPRGQDDGVEEPGVAGLSAPHAGRRRADREHLSGWHQHAPGAPCARRPVWRGGGQGHGEPDLAQGEERLGRVERPLVGRRADRAAHSRRHRGARAARPQSDLHLAPRRHRRTRGRPKGGARDQEHGWRKHRGLAYRPPRSHKARLAEPHAQEPFRARARAPA